MVLLVAFCCCWGRIRLDCWAAATELLDKDEAKTEVADEAKTEVGTAEEVPAPPSTDGATVTVGMAGTEARMTAAAAAAVVLWNPLNDGTANGDWNRPGRK